MKQYLFFLVFILYSLQAKSQIMRSSFNINTNETFDLKLFKKNKSKLPNGDYEYRYVTNDTTYTMIERPDNYSLFKQKIGEKLELQYYFHKKDLGLFIVIEKYLSYSIQMYNVSEKSNEQKLQPNRLSFREMFAVIKKDMQIDLNDTATTKVLSFKDIDKISCFGVVYLNQSRNLWCEVLYDVTTGKFVREQPYQTNHDEFETYDGGG